MEAGEPDQPRLGDACRQPEAGAGGVELHRRGTRSGKQLAGRPQFLIMLKRIDWLSHHLRQPDSRGLARRDVRNIGAP